jgi:UDP-glucose 4-epimerase
MIALVTGGAGFIGSHLVEALVRRGDGVRVLDNLSTGRISNLASVIDRVEFLEGDIRDVKAVDSAVEGVDGIFHQAAMVSVPLSVEQPMTNHAINVDGTLNVLEAARRHRVGKVVYASSASVYGDENDPPLVETMAPRPISPYGLSKFVNEQYARLYARTYGISAIGLRYFNVYGPRQDPGSPYSGVITIFIHRMMSGRRPTIYGDGTQTRDYVYVSDIVRANLLAAESAGGAGDVFNISTNHETSVLELWHALTDTAGVDLAPEFGPERPGDVQRSWASFERARRVLGYEPLVELTEGIRRTLEWMRAADDLR